MDAAWEHRGYLGNITEGAVRNKFSLSSNILFNPSVSVTFYQQSVHMYFSCNFTERNSVYFLRNVGVQQNSGAFLVDNLHTPPPPNS